jgi:hypothetical protein
MALGARFLKLTPWHYISGKEVTISLPPEFHLQEKTLRDECLWSFGHSGLHKTNSSFVFRVRMCGCESKTFSRPSSRTSLSVRQIKAPSLSADFSVGHGVGGSVALRSWFPIHPQRTQTAHILLRNKFLVGKVSCSLSIMPPELFVYSNRRR